MAWRCRDPMYQLITRMACATDQGSTAQPSTIRDHWWRCSLFQSSELVFSPPSLFSINRAPSRIDQFSQGRLYIWRLIDDLIVTQLGYQLRDTTRTVQLVPYVTSNNCNLRCPFSTCPAMPADISWRVCVHVEAKLNVEGYQHPTVRLNEDTTVKSLTS